MKNLENLIFFFPKNIFICEIVNILGLYEYFAIDSPTNLQRYYRYFTHSTQFPTAHSCSNQTIFCFFHDSFSQQLFHSPQLTAAFAKSIAQPNTSETSNE
jgi:hypothetical protein